MSSLANKVDVLVVGAGPTGLMSALALVRAGVEVEIIDRAWRSTSQSYACGLHGASLDLLASFGLADKAKEAGLAVDVLGVYEGTRRQAELRFDTPGGRAGLMV
ncbi:MAG TPA: FAD-dependent monooxygenase, partial [Myxococcota bacterium]|nr:FAD-dependent monooxygenase [Myxococcota bacterium]